MLDAKEIKEWYDMYGLYYRPKRAEGRLQCKLKDYVNRPKPTSNLSSTKPNGSITRVPRR